ncbi:MAG: hypothetical protein ABIQ41_07480 [Gemmatimonadales bacterium]
MVATALHSLLLFGWITGRPVDPVRYPHQLITLAPMEVAGREVRIPTPGPEELKSRGIRAPKTAIFAPPPPAPPRPLAERTERAASPTQRPARGRIGRLGPGLGEGLLWVEPLPLPPRQLAAVLTRKSAKELADSFVTAVVQAYLDSIAHDPDVAPLRPPVWVATVGGKKYGIDPGFIYVAGLKIPTALLAFLPIGGAGRQQPIDHALEGMAYDLRVAGARARNLDDFRRAVRELRAKKEADRRFEENRGTAPSDTLVGTVDH